MIPTPVYTTEAHPIGVWQAWYSDNLVAVEDSSKYVFFGPLGATDSSNDLQHITVPFYPQSTAPKAATANTDLPTVAIPTEPRTPKPTVPPQQTAKNMRIYAPYEYTDSLNKRVVWTPYLLGSERQEFDSHLRSFMNYCRWANMRLRPAPQAERTVSLSVVSREAQEVQDRESAKDASNNGHMVADHQPERSPYADHRDIHGRFPKPSVPASTTFQASPFQVHKQAHRPSHKAQQQRYKSALSPTHTANSVGALLTSDSNTNASTTSPNNQSHNGSSSSSSSVHSPTHLQPLQHIQQQQQQQQQHYYTQNPQPPQTQPSQLISHGSYTQLPLPLKRGPETDTKPMSQHQHHPTNQSNPSLSSMSSTTQSGTSISSASPASSAPSLSPKQQGFRVPTLPHEYRPMVPDSSHIHNTQSSPQNFYATYQNYYNLSPQNEYQVPSTEGPEEYQMDTPSQSPR